MYLLREDQSPESPNVLVPLTTPEQLANIKPGELVVCEMTVTRLAVVEAVLNYGSWDQTQKLISILGVDQAANLFAWHKSQPLTNLHPLAINYYSYYFARHAPKRPHL